MTDNEMPSKLLVKAHQQNEDEQIRYQKEVERNLRKLKHTKDPEKKSELINEINKCNKKLGELSDKTHELFSEGLREYKSRGMIKEVENPGDIPTERETEGEGRKTYREKTLPLLRKYIELGRN